MPTSTTVSTASDSTAAASASPYRTLPEVADYLRVSAAKVKADHLAGRGPRFVRFGRCLRCHIDELKSWAEQQVTA